MRKMTDKKEDELEIELPDIPDVDIEYQEDDGNNDCGDGGCVI